MTPIFDINEFCSQNPPQLHHPSLDLTKPRPHLVLGDGTKLSVQASAYHYSLPKSSEGPYTHVEIGFPSRVIEKLLPYMETYLPEEGENPVPTERVYAYVPVEVINSVLVDAGGIVKLIAYKSEI